MMRHVIAAAALLSLGLVGLLVWAQEEKAPEADENFPPRVVKTVPDDRATDVDPDLREIKVTYDRPMNTEGYSWIMHRQLGAYPGWRESAAPRWEDGGRTCVLPVRMERGTVYAVGVNSVRHFNFRDTKGRIAVPHVWVFRTSER